ncbi:hypothetical protein [Kordiimonas sp.]|uniref:hypothetical protein n=1 Tax=Kordiimonas sp. TaxID=1970157 RepID=UPI003A93C3A8
MQHFQRKTWKDILVRGVAAAIASSVAAGHALACVSTTELKADQIRFLDMQLRVAALQCRNRGTGFPGLYNAFVLTHRSKIQDSRAPVESYLTRLSIGSMDHYTTRQANLISFESTQVHDFCHSAMLAATFAIELHNPLDGMDLLPVAYKAPKVTCADADTALIRSRSGPAHLR